MSRSTDPVGRPKNWHKAVQAAGYRVAGATEEEAAKRAQVSVRTLQRWRKCSWWESAINEAMGEYLTGLRERVMGTVMTKTADDPRLALSIAERMIPELAPPKLIFERRSRIDRVLESMSPEELRRVLEMTDEELEEAGLLG